MPVGLGPRFLIEAGFLIAVAVVAGIARFGTWTIVLVMACAWLLVAAAEWFAAQSRRRAAAPTGAAAAPEPAVWAEPRRVVAPPPPAQQPQQLEPQPAPAPEVMPRPIPEPEPQAQPEPEPEHDVPQTEPEPEPQQPRVQVVPPPPRESPPQPEPEPEPAREPAVVSITSRMGPREWNLWDLERIARDTSGSDVARDEERSYLLMYLRDFANADGMLPADFDSVIRESFGDVLDAAYSS